MYILVLPAIGFDPMSYELWAHHASTAPRRFQPMVRKKIWKINAYNI